MAFSFAHGVVHWLAADAATTTYTVSGLSFQPKAIRFYWVGIHSATDAASSTAHGRRGMGFATGTSARRAIGTFSEDAALTSNCGGVACDDCVAVTTDGAGARDGLLDLNSITSDGFVLIVDDQVPVNISVFYEAWGGDEITVATVGDIAEPAATGTVDYTVTGFVGADTDQVVMLAGCQSTAAVNTAASTDSGFHVGFATGASNQVTFCGNADDGSATMDTDGYNHSGECLSMVVIGGGTTADAIATFSQFGTNNFRLNWTSRAVTDRRSIFMAIKGGQWTAGSYIIDGATASATATVSGLTYEPVGVLFIENRSTEATSGVAGSNDRLSLGTASSTSDGRAMGYFDLTGQADATVTLHVNYSRILQIPSPQETGYLLNAVNSDGFQVINDNGGGVANEFHGYLAFGSSEIPIGTAPATTSYARFSYKLRRKQRFVVQ